MARSKIDRTNDFYRCLIDKAIDSCRLQAFNEGKSLDAEALARWQERIKARSQADGTYQRLELEDIIKGHKRAWPES